MIYQGTSNISNDLSSSGMTPEESATLAAAKTQAQTNDANVADIKNEQITQNAALAAVETVINGNASDISNLKTETSTLSDSISIIEKDIVVLKNGIKTSSALLTITQDLSNSDPAGCLTVSDDLASLSEAQTLEWLGLKPILFANSNEAGDLNPNNYAQFTTGSAADITTLGNDVMVKHPARAWKIWKENGKTYRQLTDDLNASGFVKYAFIDESNTLKDAFYLGAYEAYASSNKLYSSSGKQPTVSTTLGNFRTYAKNRGTGYCLQGWYQLLYQQLCYLFVHRSLNGQAKVGLGNVSSSAALQTGTLNAKGASYGDTSGTTAVKCNYIENPWGNVFTWVDKFCTGSAGQPLVTTGPGNDTGAGYSDPLGGANHFNTTSGTSWDWLKETTDTNELGFYPYSLTGGSASTYYSDDSYCSDASYPLAIVGGGWRNGAGAGPFYFRAYSAATDADSSIGARVCFL